VVPLQKTLKTSAPKASKSIMKYSAASWRARTAVLCIRRLIFHIFCASSGPKRLQGAFLMRRFVDFETYRSPLELPFLGNSGEAFSCRLSVMRTIMQPLWLIEGMEVFPQLISGLFVWHGPWLVMFMVTGVLFRHARVVTSLLCVYWWLRNLIRKHTPLFLRRYQG
jgi:hypothetical protein